MCVFALTTILTLCTSVNAVKKMKFQIAINALLSFFALVVENKNERIGCNAAIKSNPFI